MLLSLWLSSASVSSPFESLSSTISKPLGYHSSFSFAQSFYGLSSECCRGVSAHCHFSPLLFLYSSYGQCFLYIMKEEARFCLGKKKWFQVSDTVQASVLNIWPFIFRWLVLGTHLYLLLKNRFTALLVIRVPEQGISSKKENGDKRMYGFQVQWQRKLLTNW